MARPTLDGELTDIERIVRARPGITSADIADALTKRVTLRTLQNHLRRLVSQGRLIRKGADKSARYHAPDETAIPNATATTGSVVALSHEGEQTRAHVRQPVAARKPVGYNREFLDSYRPGETYYLPLRTRTHLADIGARRVPTQDPAGTFARRILSRLLIDLSWNSSRLEGNTYSLLDTKRLIEFGKEAAGRDRLETQMILNHKDAVEFLVDNAGAIGFNRYTFLNLHSILANNLMADEGAPGRIRHIAVGISGSVYHPPETPQFIEECFDQLLATAAAIPDPYEQSFFVMVHLPYLQPFDDVNKRVSRMAANIPFIRANLSPLSFTDLSRDLYTYAILGVYELNRIELLRDVFIWSYERSAERYIVVQQTIGEPDPFRLQYRGALRTVVGETVRSAMTRGAAADHVAAWAAANVTTADQEKFRELAENELLGLHEGNFARYAIRPGEFAAWRTTWA